MTASCRVLIGGVGYRWHGDGSFGLLAADEMATLEWPPGIEIADLGYGALWVAQDLAAATPPYDRLILLAATARGDQPGHLRAFRWQRRLPDVDEIQARIREAGAGVIDLDHLLIIAEHFGALPEDVVVIELEPQGTAGGDALSEAARRCVPDAIAAARQAALAPRRPRTPTARTAP